MYTLSQKYAVTSSPLGYPVDGITDVDSFFPSEKCQSLDKRIILEIPSKRNSFLRNIKISSVDGRGVEASRGKKHRSIKPQCACEISTGFCGLQPLVTLGMIRQSFLTSAQGLCPERTYTIINVREGCAKIETPRGVQDSQMSKHHFEYLV